MKAYISVPRGVERYFKSLYPEDDIIVRHDPDGYPVGSGGAVKYLTKEHTSRDKCIVINAGGEGRRLPAYNGYGKVLMPMPVAKWSRGQKVSQRLFELQKDYLERLSDKSPERITTIIASGDVLLTLPSALPAMPDADIILVGLWGDALTMGRHGVFLCDPDDPRYYEGMIQKPSLAELDKLGKSYLTLLDSGTWLFSQKALDYLYTLPDPTDLYTDMVPFPDDLKVAVYPIEEGEFYHFGTTGDLLESTVRYQNRYRNQRRLLSKRWKLHSPSFVLNSFIEEKLSDEKNSYVWIENSFIPQSWSLSHHHVLTGIPENSVELSLPEGLCLDIVPLRVANGYAVKIYRYDDTFKEHEFFGREIEGDLYDAKLFPYMSEMSELPRIISDIVEGRDYDGAFSLRELPGITDWEAIEIQRERLYKKSLSQMQSNWDRSVFYHSDLREISRSFEGVPSLLPDDTPHLIRMQDAAFRAEMGLEDEDLATELLGETLSESLKSKKKEPYRNIYADQLIWSRSPVRIDLAGGWTDTPPYCIFEGGTVVNIAATLNGQEPIQTYVKPSEENTITINSIDLASTETIRDLYSLRDYKSVGSAFSIPKAALVLCGIGSEDSSWSDLIDRIGGGLEITLFSAVPAGSGLGTSSILGATVLSALSEYFGLGWDKTDICKQTLVLEQMLTTGGGWQDQYGGIFGGAKLLTTENGIIQDPTVRFLSPQVFTHNECQILFYTGITRKAKDILSNIRERMMLNDHATLSLLRHIKVLGQEISEAISRADYNQVGYLLSRSWEANKALDPGSTTLEIESLTREIDDLSLGYKLPGAGGGGFLYVLAKDPSAASLVRKRLTEMSNGTARLVDMEICMTGTRTTRS